MHWFFYEKRIYIYTNTHKPTPTHTTHPHTDAYKYTNNHPHTNSKAQVWPELRACVATAASVQPSARGRGLDALMPLSLSPPCSLSSSAASTPRPRARTVLSGALKPNSVTSPCPTLPSVSYLLASGYPGYPRSTPLPLTSMTFFSSYHGFIP